MRRLSFAILIGLALAGAAPAAAAVSRDGHGLALADDTYFVWPDEPGAFGAAARDWFGRRFAALRPRAFRFQIHWNADPALVARAAMLADYVRGQGVSQVTVTFKKNGPVPDAATYGASIRTIVERLADRVDAWGAANEPNIGDTWLPGTDGARTLAGYWSQFAAAVDQLDPTALKLSPEFADRRDLGSIGDYVGAYREAGGGFGDVIGWHAYWGTHHATRSTTDDLLAHVPAQLPVWVTEVGGFGRNTNGPTPIGDDEPTQNARLDWLVNDADGLARHPRVARIHHYHMRDTGQPDWDSALLRNDGRPRPSWYTLCAAAHGDRADAPDCRRDYQWLLRDTNSADAGDVELFYGHPPFDRPVAGDWDGDGTDAPAVYGDARWQNRNRQRRWSGELAFLFDSLAHTPRHVLLRGDWDGDGTATTGVYRRADSRFLLRNSGSVEIAFAYGSAGDTPVVGDWNGDGVDTVGVVRVAP